jgi:ribosomal protein L7/L12
MTSTNFRTIAYALRNVQGMDTYAVLNAADAVERTVEGMVAQGIEDYKRANPVSPTQVVIAQNILNRAAGTLPEALAYFNKSQKINAIKVVRTEFGVGLKAAKDAVESAPFALAADAAVSEAWAEYHERMSNYCCTDCNGEAPEAPSGNEPLAQWERELLGG